MHYVGVVKKDPDSEFGIAFPDLPGCVSAGKTMPEARRRAAEALAVHLDGMIAAGRPLPVARDLSAIRDDPTCAYATTLILVEVPTKPVAPTRTV
jgi:predicted RNase H-like HicB family nuclease